MKSQLKKPIHEHVAILNKIELLAETLPDSEDGVAPMMISDQVFPSVFYSAGESMKHMPAILSAYGRDGWTLFRVPNTDVIMRKEVMGVAISVENVDPASELLPECRVLPPQTYQPSIPSTEQAVS